MLDKHKSDIVNVVARIKPNISEETTSQCLQIIADPPAIAIKDRPQNHYFIDHVFDEYADQESIYEKSIKHLVDKVMLGYNCTVFAYGQTGSGKTYTMGTDGSSQGDCNDRGIIIRTIDDIMNRTDDNVKLNVSFYEIYNEKVYDLLSDKDNGGPLKVKGFQICDLTKVPINTFYEGCTYLRQGVEKRHKGETKQNIGSSRSHAIFTIYVDVQNENTEFNAFSSFNTKLNLVDLAGSECVKRTGTEGTQFLEGVNINLGLLSIGQVISALSKNINNNHIPYRESIITTVLKDSLNRNNYITLIACISANILDLFDTIQTLDFAQRAKKLKNKPEINMTIDQNKASKTPARYLHPPTKKHPPVLSTPLKRPPPFTTSTSFNSNHNHPRYLSTPSLLTTRSTQKLLVNVKSSSDHCFVPPRSVKTALSCVNVNTSEIVPLCSTFMSELNADNSLVSTSSVVSSRLDATALSPVIRGYLESIHNDAMSKLDDAIQGKLDTLSKINLTMAEIIKIRQVIQVTPKTSNKSSSKKGFVVDSEESPVPNEYSTFVENLTTPNRSARTNLQKLFESPNQTTNNGTIFKVPKPMPRKRKLLTKTTSNDSFIRDDQKNNASPPKRRCSIRLLEKDLKILFENSMLKQHDEATDNVKSSPNFMDKKSEILNTRKSMRLSMKVVKKSPGKKIVKSKSKIIPIPAPRYKVVSTPQDNYNRILNILNNGSEKKLMELSSVGVKTAKQIYLYRSIKGKLNKISDLSAMPWNGNTYKRFLSANFLDNEDK